MSQIFWKITILVKILENLDFGLNFWKISILVKIVKKNLDSGQNSWNSRFIFKNLDFAQTFQIIKFCEKLLYIISILWKFSKIFILVKINKILDFGQNFQKSWFQSKILKNIDFR